MISDSNIQRTLSFSQQIVEMGKRLWIQGMTPGGDGNISVKFDQYTILITPSGISLGHMKPDDLVMVDFSGDVIGNTGKPSMEINLHLIAYKLRDDIGAVVHAHPPYATVFSCTSEEIPVNLTSEILIKVGEIPKVPFAPPGSIELARLCEQYVINNDAFLLSNHGVVTLGCDLEQAGSRMELVDHISKIALLSRKLKNIEYINPSDMKTLKDIKTDLNRKNID